MKTRLVTKGTRVGNNRGAPAVACAQSAGAGAVVEYEAVAPVDSTGGATQSGALAALQNLEPYAVGAVREWILCPVPARPFAPNTSVRKLARGVRIPYSDLLREGIRWIGSFSSAAPECTGYRGSPEVRPHSGEKIRPCEAV